MKQELQVEKPTGNEKTLSEMPKTGKMVKAISLLSQQEQMLLPKNIRFITVSAGTETFIVKLDDYVPVDAVPVRAKSGSLIGLPVVVGG